MDGVNHELCYFLTKYRKLYIAFIVLIIIGLMMLIFWKNFYSGEVTCIRWDGVEIYYQYDINGIKKLTRNGVEQSEEKIELYSLVVDVGFDLKPNGNLNKILAYETYDRSEVKKSTCEK